MKNKIIETKFGNFSIIDTETDGPNIVFLSGLGSFAYDYYFTMKDLSNKYRGISIDRLGLGDSDPVERKRTANNISEELNELFHTLNLENYLLVAHDSAAIYARKIAEEKPINCKKILLLDPITENDNQFDELNIPNWHNMASIRARIEAMEQYKSIDRDLHKKMLKAMADIMYERFPEDIQEKVMDYNSDKKSIFTIINEYKDRNDAFKELNCNKLDIPIWIIMRDPRVMITISQQYEVPQYEAKVVEELWFRNITDMMDISYRSRLIEAKGTDHNMPLNSPIIVADYIRELSKL